MLERDADSGTPRRPPVLPDRACPPADWPAGVRADAASTWPPTTSCARARATCSSRAAPAPASRRCSRCTRATACPSEMVIARAHGPCRRQRRRPDHPFLLRLPAAPDPARRHPPQPQRPPHAAPQVPRHRRGVDGALRPDVGHRPVAARQPRPAARSLRRRAARACSATCISCRP